MTKSELIERLATQQSHIPAKTVEDAVKEMLEHMASTLAQGERIEIRGFGSFSLHYRAPRTGRNPKTGDKVELEGKYVPHFKLVKNCAIAPIFTVKFYSNLNARKAPVGCFFISLIRNWKLPRRVLSSFHPLVKFF